MLDDRSPRDWLTVGTSGPQHYNRHRSYEKFFFGWLNQTELRLLHYTQKKIESYSFLVTLVSPKKYESSVGVLTSGALRDPGDMFGAV